MSNNSSITANGAQVKIRRIFQNVKTRNNFPKFVRTLCLDQFISRLILS